MRSWLDVFAIVGTTGLTLSKTSGRNVTYNYLVVDGQAAGPTSSLDDASGVLEFEDVSRGISPVAGAVVVIKVVDQESQCALPLQIAVSSADGSRLHVGLGTLFDAAEQNASSSLDAAEARSFSALQVRWNFHRRAPAVLLLYWLDKASASTSQPSIVFHNHPTDTVPIHHGGHRLLSG